MVNIARMSKSFYLFQKINRKEIKLNEFYFSNFSEHFKITIKNLSVITLSICFGLLLLFRLLFLKLETYYDLINKF